MKSTQDSYPLSLKKIYSTAKPLEEGDGDGDRAWAGSDQGGAWPGAREVATREDHGQVRRRPDVGDAEGRTQPAGRRPSWGLPEPGLGLAGGEGRQDKT
jgi:hypothetical protein